MEFILFADTNLFLQDTSLSSLESRLNVELEKISSWFKVNKLSLNLNKTNYILFQKKSKITDNPINVKIDNVPIGKVKQTKFLGLIINDKLSW